MNMRELASRKIKTLSKLVLDKPSLRRNDLKQNLNTIKITLWRSQNNFAAYTYKILRPYKDLSLDQLDQFRHANQWGGWTSLKQRSPFNTYNDHLITVTRLGGWKKRVSWAPVHWKQVNKHAGVLNSDGILSHFTVRVTACWPMPKAFKGGLTRHSKALITRL